MKTSEVLKRHEKKFNKVKFLIKTLLVIVVASIIVIQWKNIIQLFKSI